MAQDKLVPLGKLVTSVDLTEVLGWRWIGELVFSSHAALLPLRGACQGRETGPIESTSSVILFLSAEAEINVLRPQNVVSQLTHLNEDLAVLGVSTLLVL